MTKLKDIPFKWIILVIILIVFSIICGKHDKVPYSNLEYKIDGYCSCISFGTDGTFGEYDCDSEPSEMPFSGEYYDEYYYNSATKIITFKPNGDGDSIFRLRKIKAKVLEWTEEKLVIKVLNSSIIDFSNAKKCAVDGKSTYEYLIYDDE